MTALDGGLERIVIRPDLQVVPGNLLWTEFVDENGLLSLIAIPPYVVALREQPVREDGTAVQRLACACGTPVILTLS